MAQDQENAQGGEEQAQQPVFGIEKIYVKDVSLEIPNAPHVFLERETPEVGIELPNAAAAIGDGVFEAVITVTVTSKIEDKTVFLVEVAQAGIFQIRNIPEGDLEPVTMIGCPNILFPYAREAISDAVTRAGFQPVVLAPVNFEALYQAQQQAPAREAGELPIQ